MNKDPIHALPLPLPKAHTASKKVDINRMSLNRSCVTTVLSKRFIRLESREMKKSFRRTRERLTTEQ